MGFAVSAAMGAKLASPDRTVVALIGDGGLQMSGLELAVAVRENLNVVVIVFNDGHFGLIRKIQLGHDGYEYGVSLPRLNIEDFAGSIGVGYENGSTNLASAFERAILRSGPTVIEIILGDSTAIRRMQATSRAKDIVRKTLGKKFVNFVKRFS
jgi:acetolactate synthase-1/2/3 large subunit